MDPVDRVPDSSGAEVINRLVGVYDAEGTLRGEIVYWVGARLGRRHCALCDITHGLLRRRREWDACRADLPVSFDTHHLDDQPDDVRSAASGEAPVVLARTTERLVVLLGRDDIEQCAGSVDALVAAIESAADDHGLRWPS